MASLFNTKKHKRLKHMSMLLTILLSMMVLLPTHAFAVTTTEKPTGSADSIYVAGNPDWYPVEYYNEESKSYEGILPEILEEITAETGLKFTYVEAGSKDQRRLLAKNRQVELVSGCRRDDGWLKEVGASPSGEIFTVPTDEGDIEACFAFTKIADRNTIAKMERAISAITAKEVSGITIKFLSSREEEKHYPWMIVITVAIIAFMAIIAMLITRLVKYRRTYVKDERIDVLTGIWNKNYFVEIFDKYISEEYGNLYCVTYIGFDIVRVNQYYGEGAAEDQLCFAANVLQESTSDREIVARVSGGGFAVAHLTSGEDEIERWIGELLDRLNSYTDRYGKDYRPFFKAGIYMLQPRDKSCEDAIFNAKQGYQQAVARALPFAFAKKEDLKRESEQLQLKKQTLDALNNREFKMFIQLIVSGDDWSICGGEAISRWDHPQKGLLFPGSYIDLMESEGTIAELDFYIFDEVCRQLEEWQKAGRWIYLSCNFARITIGRENFVDRVEAIASKYGFNRDFLIMEITEDAMETNRQIAFKNLSRCKELGFRIALDDAGSGYTSFADLRDYPIDVVKIDKSILNSVTTPRGAALLRGISALVHNLDMKVLCEGAETETQANLLRNIGCDYIQGYFFYRPLPLSEIERILMERQKSNDLFDEEYE